MCVIFLSAYTHVYVGVVCVERGGCLHVVSLCVVMVAGVCVCVRVYVKCKIMFGQWRRSFQLLSAPVHSMALCLIPCLFFGLFSFSTLAFLFPHTHSGSLPCFLHPHHSGPLPCLFSPPSS